MTAAVQRHLRQLPEPCVAGPTRTDADRRSQIRYPPETPSNLRVLGRPRRVRFPPPPPIFLLLPVSRQAEWSLWPHPTRTRSPAARRRASAGGGSPRLITTTRPSGGRVSGDPGTPY